MKSILLIIIISLGGKLLGLIREMLIAAKYGAGAQTDAFFIALTAVTLATALLMQAINTTMIPILSEIETKDGRKGKVKLTNNIFNIVFLLSFIIVIFGWILSPYIIKVLALGFEGEQYKLTVLLTRIGFTSIIFAGIVGVFRGYLQSEQKFTETSISEWAINITYIIFLLFMSKMFGIKGLMVASVIAVGAQLIVQNFGLKKTGFRYKFTIDLKDKYVRRIFYLISPVLISVAVSHVNKIADKTLASTLINGSISALDYSSRLNLMVLGVFITAITTVIFPILSKEANKINYHGLKKIIRHGINSILLITIPATVVMVVLAGPIVSIIFERGAFDSNATDMTAGALVFYSLGLSGMATRLFLVKVFYSLQDTRTPMTNSFIVMLLNIFLNLILINSMQHEGIAFATSISVTVITFLLLFSLTKKIGSLGIGNLISCIMKCIIAASVMGIVIHFLYYLLIDTFLNMYSMNILAMIISLIVGSVIYLIIIYFLKVEELKWLLSLIKKER